MERKQINGHLLIPDKIIHARLQTARDGAGAEEEMASIEEQVGYPVGRAADVEGIRQ